MPKRSAKRRGVLVAGLACAWLLLACAPALAHANLVEASPPQGSEVYKPPERVELRFSEPGDGATSAETTRAQDGHHGGHHGGGAGGVASTDRREPAPGPAAGGAATRAA